MSSNKSKSDAETATIFQRVINVIDHFESYTHIEQIADLANRVKKIKNELCVKVEKEFEEVFRKPYRNLQVKYSNHLKLKSFS